MHNYDPRDFYVPSDWRPIFSNSQHAGDFVGDPCVDANIFIGWLTPDNGFVSPDKAMDKHKSKVETAHDPVRVTASESIRPDAHFIIMNQVLPRMAYVPSMNMMEYILESINEDIDTMGQDAFWARWMISGSEIANLQFITNKLKDKG